MCFSLAALAEVHVFLQDIHLVLGSKIIMKK